MREGEANGEYCGRSPKPVTAAGTMAAKASSDAEGRLRPISNGRGKRLFRLKPSITTLTRIRGWIREWMRGTRGGYRWDVGDGTWVCQVKPGVFRKRGGISGEKPIGTETRPHNTDAKEFDKGGCGGWGVHGEHVAEGTLGWGYRRR